MKVSGTFFLMLPLVSISIPVPDYEFTSAKSFNICGKLHNNGSGFGRVSLATISAMCLDTKKMSMRCHFHLPVDGPRELASEYPCQGDKYCVPSTPAGKNFPDSGCISIPHPAGQKGSGDLDNYACTSGLHVGDDPIYLLSSISADKAAWTTSIVNPVRQCSVVQSGTEKFLFKHAPCEQTSTVLQLQARTTYQACVGTLAELAKKSISFHWHLSAPGKLARGLDTGRPLSEMVTVVNGNSDDAIQIVIED